MKKNASSSPASDFIATSAFVGVDISKLHFDAALCLANGRQRQPTLCQRFANDLKGLKAFEKWIAACAVTAALREQMLVVIENTGVYHRQLWRYATDTDLRLVIVNGAEMKWSMGLARGKNDRVDSIRICDYAFQKADELKLAPKLNGAILELKDLYAARLRLQKDLKGHRVAIKELEASSDKKVQARLIRLNKPAIAGIEKSLQLIEEDILAVIREHEDLNASYKLLLSIPGIGFVTAVYLICCTTNFILKPTGKQLACYAGVAPFGNASGSSIKGKPRVHKMANKELKKLLHMGARSIAAHHGEAKTYYDRKQAQGKHDLSIINAIKNKMLLRVAAVIREGRPFVDKSRAAA